MDQLMKGLLSLAGAVPEVNPIAIALRNNLSVEQTAKEWACPGCTKRFTACLADPSESVMRIMHSIAMLVALAIPSLMVNSSASGVVVLPAGALENDTC